MAYSVGVNMKTKDLVLIGALIGGAYLLFKSQPTTAQVSNIQAPQEVVSVAPNGATVTETIHTPAEGVDAINRAITQGRTLLRTSKTLAYNPATNTGVAKLGDGSIKQITVSSVERDSAGLSEWDRRIIRNYKEAIARGESPSISNDLKPYV